MLKISKIKTAFIVLALMLVSYFLLSKTISAETIIVPKEDLVSQEKLDRAITVSKFNIDSGIEELESLTDLSEYTDYKRKYILARLYEKKKNINKAIQIYESILEKSYPLKERVLFHLAILNASLNDDKKAIRYFDNLLVKFPTSRSIPEAKYYLAQTQLRLRLTRDALSTLNSLKIEFPRTQYGIATNYYLGEYEYNKQNYKEALNFWREYLKKSPDGRFSPEIVSVITSTQKNIPIKPSDYSLIGDVYFNKKEYKKAAYYYQIENNVKKYYALGYSLFRIGENSKAEKYFKEFAYTFPKSKNVKWSLFYCSKCMPSFLRKSFWEKVTKDIPDLAYYTLYKEGLVEENEKKRKEIFLNLMELYPQGEFTLDAVWELMWSDIKTKNYNNAVALGKKYFESNLSSSNCRSESCLKIGFWLGKVSELQNKKFDAIDFYKKVQSLNSDNYYYYRSKNRLLALTGGVDPKWDQQSSYKELKDLSWSIPVISRLDNLTEHFGITVTELIKLQQFDEAIEIIGKNSSPSKQITSWLKALNSEYDTSINIATSTIVHYGFSNDSPLWKLAYPLYFWQDIVASSSRFTNLDPLLACGVIRQESRFDPNATSISNAFGLMQLIIPTAKVVARQSGVNLSSNESLKDPKINISLGTYYLKGLLSDFSSPLFAVASYNAGPNAVKNWVNKYGTSDLDLFIEYIPYDETRGYVKKVFSSYWTYLELYNKF